jgi:hypothetical protein
MTDPIFKSDRTFVVFSYSAERGLLLLRSRKTNVFLSRIDVLIQDVRAMEIRSWFEGLEIIEVGLDYLNQFRSDPIKMVEPGNRVYALNGNSWQGFIVGGIITVGEDDADYVAPSKLMR